MPLRPYQRAPRRPRRPQVAEFDECVRATPVPSPVGSSGRRGLAKCRGSTGVLYPLHGTFLPAMHGDTPRGGKLLQVWPWQPSDAGGTRETRVVRVLTRHEEDGATNAGGGSAWHAWVATLPLVQEWREERFGGQ